MGYNVFLVPLAFLVDLLVGDPPRKTHPVVLIGKAIQVLIKGLGGFGAGRRTGLVRGALLAFTVVIGGYIFTAATVNALGLCAPVLSACASVWLVSTTVAAKGLARAARQIESRLNEGDIDGARKSVANIVGRDTLGMSEEDIIRATVETVAENTVDAVVSPIFYAFIGGAPLAMAYRATNTLDSMVGYKDDRFRYFGRASARLDDAVNYLPARITGILIVIASLIARENYRNAFRMLVRDSHKHLSPNSGFPEASVAGALGVQLGGRNVYRNKVSIRAYMGEPLYKLDITCIGRTVRLMYITGVLSVFFGVVLALVWGKFF